MRLRPYLLAGVMAISLTSAGALYHHEARAAESGAQAAPIVLAQNGDGNRGFFNRIFNRRDDTNKAKPLYLNKGSSGGVRPYDFSNGRAAIEKRRRSSGSVSWEAFDRARQQYAMEVAARADAASQRLKAESDREVAAMMASYAGRSGPASSAGAGTGTAKRMVYDPARVWTYNPNRPDNTDRPRPRIYNTSP